ncbi:MAG: hypothetical protein ACK4GJ_03005 [bacterium]
MSKINRIFYIAAIMVMISLSVFLSGCFKGSSQGRLNPILLGGGSLVGQQEQLELYGVIPFDDISDNPGVIEINNTHFGGVDDRNYRINGGLPFEFYLLGRKFDAGRNLTVDINGYISFDDDIPSLFVNTNINNILNNYDSFIAPFWDDLYIVDTTKHKVWYIIEGTAPNRRLIVQWYMSGFSNTDNQVVFQVILFEGSNEIEFLYTWMRDVNSNDSSGSAANPTGSSATIGVISGADGYPNGLQKIYSVNTAVIPTIPAGQAFYVYFAPTNSIASDYQIQTGFVNSNLDPSSLNVLPNLLINELPKYENKKEENNR